MPTPSRHAAAWPDIQAMVRAVATTDAQAEAAIARANRLYSDRAAMRWSPPESAASAP